MRFIAAIFVTLFIIGLIVIFKSSQIDQSLEVKYGITFSPKYARYLGLDWKKTYLNVLDDLKVKNLRLPSYWDVLEKYEGKYDFSETDFMLTEAAKRGVKVILVLGARQPRWPECHVSIWAKKLTVAQSQQKTLDFIQKVVERYKKNASIWAYQVENEPFAYWFGECDSLDKKFLLEEIQLVKTLDTKPIILTDSGEWSSWVDVMKLSDILGISIYKKAYNPNLHTYLDYPFLPWMYDFKSTLVRKIFAPKNEKTIVMELQTEPWLSDKDAKEGSPARENQLFSPSDFKSNIEFVKKTGFDEAYLWGVEWWYWMAAHGHPEYLQFAKTLFKP